MTNRETLERLNAEPVVSLGDFKAHQLIEHDLDDALCTSYLLAASEYAELTTERTYMLSRYRLGMRVWPSVDRLVSLEGIPLRAIESVTYLDSIGVKQELPAAAFSIGESGLVFTAALPELWVDCPALPQIEIVYVAGFGTYAPGALSAGYPVSVDIGTRADTPPSNIQQAVKMIAGWWYEQRESAVVGTIVTEVPIGAQALLHQRRILGV